MIVCGRWVVDGKVEQWVTLKIWNWGAGCSCLSRILNKYLTFWSRKFWHSTVQGPAFLATFHHGSFARFKSDKLREHSYWSNSLRLSVDRFDTEPISPWFIGQTDPSNHVVWNWDLAQMVNRSLQSTPTLLIYYFRSSQKIQHVLRSLDVTWLSRLAKSNCCAPKYYTRYLPFHSPVIPLRSCAVIICAVLIT